MTPSFQIKGQKGAKAKKGKDAEESRPPSQNVDTARQHWTLRVVSDAAQTEDIDVKKVRVAVIVIIDAVCHV